MAGEALNWPWIYLDRTGYEWKEKGETIGTSRGVKVGNVTLVMIVPTRKGAREGDWGRRSSSCGWPPEPKGEPRRRSGVDWQGLIGERVVLRWILMGSQSSGWLAWRSSTRLWEAKKDEADREKKGA